MNNLPLIGREADYQQLLHSVDKMFNSEGLVVLIEGEAGVGKTRLVEDISEDIEWRGGEVIWGRGKEIEIINPFSPLMDAINDSLTPLRASQLCRLVAKPWLQVLKPFLPELTSGLTDLYPAPSLDSNQEQSRLIEAITNLIKEWSNVTPLTMILEDLHWFDRDTLDLLPALASRIKEMGFLLIVTYRGEEARSYPRIWEQVQAINSAGQHRRVVLDRLDASATSELIRCFLGTEQRASIFSARIFSETEGNPLFILETLRSLIDEGLLTRDDNGYWSTPWDESTDDYAELPLPPVVERVIARRLDQASSDLREVMNIAAVFGSKFDFQLLGACAGKETSDLLRIAGDLVKKQFWLETPKAYGFIHEKIRQVTYEGIPTEERVRLHRQIGESLETLDPNQFTELAHHFLEGNIWDKAAAYSFKAGERAASLYANKEAISLYDLALGCLDQLDETPNPVQRFNILLARESVLAHQGEREAQSEVLNTLKLLAPQVGDSEQETHKYQAQVALRQAKFFEATGENQEAEAAALSAITHAKNANEPEIEAESFLELGIGLWRQGRYKDSEPKLEQALIISRAIGSGKLEADSLRNQGNICWFLGDYEGAKTYYEETLIVSHKIEDNLGEARTLNNLGVLSEHRGDHNQARKYFSQAIQIHNQIGDRRGESNTLANLANIDLYQGNYLQALENYKSSLPIRQAVEDREGEAIVLVNIGLVWNQLGEYSKAKEYYDRSLSIFQELENLWGAGYVLGFQGLLAHQTGNHGQSVELCHKAAVVANELEIGEHEGQALSFLGHAMLGLDRLDEAEEAYEKALVLREEVGHQHLVAETKAGLARLFLLQGNHKKAREYVEDILSHLKTGSFNGTDEPTRIYLTCYQVLEAIQDPRADKYLLEGVNFLDQRAAKIEDPNLQSLYREKISANRKLLEAYQKFQEQKVVVRLPSIKAPTGRPLRSDEWVEVLWTVHMSEDQASNGKVGCRRHRLQRLLEEARAQGAVPTVSDLASALNVSTATIKRDLAALRETGGQVQTRGSREISKK